MVGAWSEEIDEKCACGDIKVPGAEKCRAEKFYVCARACVCCDTLPVMYFTCVATFVFRLCEIGRKQFFSVYA